MTASPASIIQVSLSIVMQLPCLRNHRERILPTALPSMNRLPHCRPPQSPVASRLFRDVNQRAIGIGKLEGAERALGQEPEPRHALRIEVDRLGAQLQILLLDLREIRLERVEALHSEADVVHRRLLDAGAVEGGNLPRQDRYGDAAVAEEVTALLAFDVAPLELEHVGVEIGNAFGLAHADREVADGVVLLPLALRIDLGSVLVALLRQVEIVAGGVMSTVTGKGPVAGPLHDLDVGVFL